MKATFFVPLIFFAVLLWQPAVAQTSLPACAMSLPDHDNDNVAAAVDIDKDNDGLIEVCDIEGLNEMRYQLNGSGYITSTDAVKITQGCPDSGCIGYELVRSLDFADAGSYRSGVINTAWTTGADWQPIGSNTKRFSGIFEGNGYTISKLTINKPNANNLGFFGSTASEAKINNIGLLGIDIQGESRVGGLAGSNRGSVTNSYATGAVTGTGDNVGGLVGLNNGDVTNSYATGAVTGNNQIGGLVGSNRDSVTNSYATGAVTGIGGIGGLVGFNRGSVTNSYATGAVTGNNQIGGLVGSNRDSVTNSYWNTQTSGLATSAGDDGVTSATTVQLQSPTAPGTTTTEVYYGWSINDWDFGDNSHYPALRHARGDDLNACNPDITTPSAILACAVPLPNQRDRNQGLTALFVLADGDDVTAELIPTFFPLKSSYDIIATTETAVQLTLRPYAINNNATITITDQDNADYFVGKPNGALSDPIMLDPGKTLSVVVTDTINEVTVNTTYTFVVVAIALTLSEVVVGLDPAVNADGTIDEGSLATITFDVSGGSGTYQYEYLIDDQPLLSSAPSPLVYRVPTDLIKPDSVMQTIELKIIVSDGEQTVEYTEDLTVRKVNNGDPVIRPDISFVRLRLIFEGTDADGEGHFTMQWQKGVIEDAWMDIVGATTATYWLPADANRDIRYRAINIRYTDGQGFETDYDDQGPFLGAVMITGDIGGESQVNEGETLVLTVPTVSGGLREYVYQWSQTEVNSAHLSNKSTLTLTEDNATLNVAIPADFIALAATSANITFKVVVSDGEFTTSRSRVVTIHKIDNGQADIDISVTSATLTVTVGTDPDGDASEPGYEYQWQRRALEPRISWQDIMSATTASYTISDDLMADNQFRIQVTYTDAQDYRVTLESNPYPILIKGIKVRTKVFLEGPLR